MRSGRTLRVGAEWRNRLAHSASRACQIAQHVRELILDGGLREAMGNAGRQRALRSFPISRMVEQTVAVYDKLTS